MGDRVGRLLAVLSYLGLTGALVPLAQPDNPFVVRHARRALALPLLDTATGRSNETIRTFARHLSLVVLVGSPELDALVGMSGLWILGVLILTWGVPFVGFCSPVPA